MSYNINKEDLITIYNNCNTTCKKVLENLFGKEIFLKITDKVKSYEDACNILGISPILNCPKLCICEKHPAISIYPEHYSFRTDLDESTIAYLKLCTIIKALNQGWEPNLDCMTLLVALRLILKNSMLADYASEQFSDLYKAFYKV